MDLQRRRKTRAETLRLVPFVPLRCNTAAAGHWIAASQRRVAELVFYGVTCARFARIFSSDPEGHALSGRCAER